MKKYLCILICFFVCTLSLQAQKGTIPNVKTEKMDGSPMQFREILSDSIPVILTFWSTMCKPCIAELDAFSDEYEDLKRELKFKIVAVALDDERTVAKVKA
ncbi:MAG: redoxin domain-containing protein, partial [Odoribacter sp.]